MRTIPEKYHLEFNERNEIEATYETQVIGTTFSPIEADRIIMRHAAQRADINEQKCNEWQEKATAAEAQRDELAAQLATVTAERERIFAALFKSYPVMLGGRNEHGAHVIHDSVTMPDDIIWPLTQDDDMPEIITAEAEVHGLTICAFTKWTHYDAVSDSDGNCEMRAYWEYNGIDVELSKQYNDWCAKEFGL